MQWIDLNDGKHTLVPVRRGEAILIGIIPNHEGFQPDTIARLEERGFMFDPEIQICLTENFTLPDGSLMPLVLDHFTPVFPEAQRADLEPPFVVAPLREHMERVEELRARYEEALAQVDESDSASHDIDSDEALENSAAIVSSEPAEDHPAALTSSVSETERFDSEELDAERKHEQAHAESTDQAGTDTRDEHESAADKSDAPLINPLDFEAYGVHFDSFRPPETFPQELPHDAAWVGLNPYMEDVFHSSSTRGFYLVSRETGEIRNIPESEADINCLVLDNEQINLLRRATYSHLNNVSRPASELLLLLGVNAYAQLKYNDKGYESIKAEWAPLVFANARRAQSAYEKQIDLPLTEAVNRALDPDNAAQTGHADPDTALMSLVVEATQAILDAERARLIQFNDNAAPDFDALKELARHQRRFVASLGDIAKDQIKLGGEFQNEQNTADPGTKDAMRSLLSLYADQMPNAYLVNGTANPDYSILAGVTPRLRVNSLTGRDYFSYSRTMSELRKRVWRKSDHLTVIGDPSRDHSMDMVHLPTDYFSLSVLNLTAPNQGSIFSNDGNSISIDGETFSHVPLKLAARTVLSTTPEGHSLIAIPWIPQDHEIQNVAEKAVVDEQGRFLSWLAKHHKVEAAAILGRGLAAPVSYYGAKLPVALFYVSGRRRRPDPLAAPVFMDQVDNHDDLEAFYTLCASRAEERERLLTNDTGHETRLSSILRGLRENGREATEEDERYSQVPYFSMSPGETFSMMPSSQTDMQEKAFRRFLLQHGNVVDYLSERLNYSPEELASGKYYSPEQLDALALAISRLESDDREHNEFVLGDRTGVGKGRVLAGLARYHVLKNGRCIFFTKDSELAQDFWRDVVNTGSDEIIRPYVMADQISIVDPKRGVIDTGSEERNTYYARNLDWPDGANVIVTSYSQIRGYHPVEEEREQEMRRRHRRNFRKFMNRAEIVRYRNNDPQFIPNRGQWLTVIAKGVGLLLDESHMAANPKTSTRERIDAIRRESLPVCYASGTFLRNPQSLSFYQKALPKLISGRKMVLGRGAASATIQDTISRHMIAEGGMVSRELNFSAIDYQLVPDTEHRERNEETADQFAAYLEIAVEALSVANEAVREHNYTVRKRAERGYYKEAGYSGELYSLNNGGIGSILNNVSEQMLVHLCAEHSADLAISELKSGRKPLISLVTTGETLIKYMLDGDSLKNGNRVPAPTIPDLLIKVAKNLFTVTVHDLDVRIEQDKKNEQTRIIPMRGKARRKASIFDLAGVSDETKAQLRVLKQNLLDNAQTFPAEVFSPIDHILHRIEKAGYKVAEISGRNYRVVLSDDRKTGYVTQNASPRKRELISMYNNGELDSLVGSSSVATGFSLHASPVFKDLRPRTLIEAQIPQDVITRLQMFGRLNRADQVSPPRVLTSYAALPAHDRFIAMHTKKLVNVLSSIRSSPEHSVIVKTLSLLNHVGGRVIKEYLMRNPSMARRLFFNPRDLASITHDYQFSTLANQFMQRLTTMRVMDQKRVMKSIDQRFKLELDRLEAQGEDPLHNATANLMASEVFRFPVEGAVKSHYDDDDDYPVFAAKYFYTRKVHNVAHEDIEREIQKGREALANSGNEHIAKAIREDVPDMLYFVRDLRQKSKEILDRIAKTYDFDSIDDAINDNYKPLIDIDREFNLLLSELKEIRIGMEYPFYDYRKGRITTVVVDIITPPDYSIHDPSSYMIRVMSADGTNHFVSMKDVISNEYLDSYSEAKMFGPGSKVWQLIEQNREKHGEYYTEDEYAWFLVGNELRIVSNTDVKGPLMMFTDESGRMHFGRRMPHDFKPKKYIEKHGRIESENDLVELLRYLFHSTRNENPLVKQIEKVARFSMHHKPSSSKTLMLYVKPIPGITPDGEYIYDCKLSAPNSVKHGEQYWGVINLPWNKGSQTRTVQGRLSETELAKLVRKVYMSTGERFRLPDNPKTKDRSYVSIAAMEWFLERNSSVLSDDLKAKVETSLEDEREMEAPGVTPSDAAQPEQADDAPTLNPQAMQFKKAARSAP